MDKNNFMKISLSFAARIIVGSLAMVLFTTCKQDYYPPIPEGDARLLVVEGFLNGGVGPTTIRLSRTVNLGDTAVKKVELGARVTVEGENSSSVTLAGNNAGEYSIPQLTLTPNVKYRLRIRTQDGKEYASDFVSSKYTPAIDSISWIKEDDGVRLYVHTHDPQNATIYYLWEFDETWEFHSRYFSSLKYLKDNSGQITSLVYRFPDKSHDTTIYKCWKTLKSTSIIIGSSERLAADVIYLPVHFIGQGSEKLNVRYSINLKQYAVSHEKYLFLQKMKKNTEQVGSLFDAQPSQLTGNIRNISDPNESVIGYIEISEEKTKRIFVDRSQVHPWNFHESCEEFNIPNNIDSIRILAASLTPTVPAVTTPSGDVVRFFASSSSDCVDCRSNGRVNQRPPFW